MRSARSLGECVVRLALAHAVRLCSLTASGLGARHALLGEWGVVAILALEHARCRFDAAADRIEIISADSGVRRFAKRINVVFDAEDGRLASSFVPL